MNYQDVPRETKLKVQRWIKTNEPELYLLIKELQDEMGGRLEIIERVDRWRATRYN